MKSHRMILRVAGLLLGVPLLGLAPTVFAAPVPLSSQTSASPTTTSEPEVSAYADIVGHSSNGINLDSITYIGGFTSTGEVASYSVYVDLQDSYGVNGADGPWTTIASEPFSGTDTTSRINSYDYDNPAAFYWYRTYDEADWDYLDP